MCPTPSKKSHFFSFLYLRKYKMTSGNKLSAPLTSKENWKPVWFLIHFKKKVTFPPEFQTRSVWWQRCTTKLSSLLHRQDGHKYYLLFNGHGYSMKSNIFLREWIIFFLILKLLFMSIQYWFSSPKLYRSTVKAAMSWRLSIPSHTIALSPPDTLHLLQTWT